MSRIKASLSRRRARAAAAQNPSFQAFRLPRGAPDLRALPPPHPCIRQRGRPCTAGDRQGVPARVRAPQRGATRSRAASAMPVLSPLLIGVSCSFPAGSPFFRQTGRPKNHPPIAAPRPKSIGRGVQAHLVRTISVSRKNRNASPGTHKRFRSAQLPLIIAKQTIAGRFEKGRF